MKRTAFTRSRPDMGNHISTERVRPVAAPLTRPVNYGAPANDPVMAQPKREYIRNPKLLAAVRTLPCMHTGAPPPSDPAHSNSGRHGKGKGIKADDNRIAALSRETHRELDQGKNWTQAERERIWWDAHVRTVAELLRRGLWPAGVPVPDMSEFNK
jgi:hypothetical protein